MPQLKSHWDGFNWQTPTVGNILEIPRRAEDQTQQLRSLATTVVRKYAEMGTPVRLKTVERYASHTRYHIEPDRGGVRGSERPITVDDLKKSLPKLLPDLNAQAVQLVNLTPDDSTITLFLRTSDNQPIGLYEVLQKDAFVKSETYTTVPIGVDLHQHAVVRDLNKIEHLLIIGSSSGRLHLQLGIALTLTLFNSPAYLRLALVGDDASQFRHLLGSPHVLGSMITTTSGLRRLMDGLIKHISQRRQILDQQQTPALDDYNRKALSNKLLKPLPRIIMLLDTVTLEDWRSGQDQWVVPLHQILSKGAEVGIHVILASPSADRQTLPDRITELFPERVVMRSALSENTPVAPTVPLKFVDAMLISTGEEHPLPIELAAVAESELMRSVAYWQQMKTRRNADIQEKGQPIPTGNTGLLTLRSDMLPTGDTQPTQPVVEIDTGDDSGEILISDSMISAAQALAAYLGWLSVGPLRDVLHMSATEAEETLRILRRVNVLEPGDGPIWRFARLAEPPPGSEPHQ